MNGAQWLVETLRQRGVGWSSRSAGMALSHFWMPASTSRCR